MAYTLTIGNQPAGEFATEEEAKQAYYKWVVDTKANIGGPVSGTPEENIFAINGVRQYTDTTGRGTEQSVESALFAVTTGKATKEQMEIVAGLTGQPTAASALNPDYTPAGIQAGLGVSPFEGGMTTDSNGNPAPMGANQIQGAPLAPELSTAPSPFEGGMTVDSNGNPQPMGYNQQQGAPSANPAYPTNQPQTGQPQLTPEQLQQAYQQSGLTDMMNQAGLTPDQQRAIEAVYQATLANDQSYADRIAAALQAAREYSSPYFDAQIALVSDSLSRALGASEGDLAFREQQLQSALTKLQQDTAASKDHLSFQQNQEMEDLARRYEVNLEGTRQDMAATGFTVSSRRSKAEQYLSDINEGAVESSNRNLSYQTEGLDRQLQFQSQESAAQVANLQRLAAEGKLNLLRQTETQLGSTGLQSLGYTGGDVLGGVGGEIPRAQAQDALSFANSFVF